MTLDVHVEALVGRVAVEVLTFTPDRSITLGTHADCVVTGEGVLAIHGCLAYFDDELWALSANVAEPIFVDKLPAVMWTAVPPGALLSIGGARLRIAEADLRPRPSPDASLEVEVDLSELRRSSRREPVAEPVDRLDGFTVRTQAFA